MKDDRDNPQWYHHKIYNEDYFNPSMRHFSILHDTLSIYKYIMIVSWSTEVSLKDWNIPQWKSTEIKKEE